jgi:hypothetical protein
MPIVVAPDVTQLNMLLWPDKMLPGLAVNELIVGTVGVLMVTVAEAVTEPAAFVAVRT